MIRRRPEEGARSPVKISKKPRTIVSRSAAVTVELSRIHWSRPVRAQRTAISRVLYGLFRETGRRA